MIVLDTHVWLWLLSDATHLSPRVRQALARATQLGVSAISVWEVAMLVEHGRIRLDRATDVWVAEALGATRITLCPISPQVAVAAASLRGTHGDPADRLIAATAIVGGWRLATRDRKLRACTQVDTLW